MDLDIGGLPAGSAGGLMDHDLRVRQRQALPLGPAGQKHRRHARRQPNADRRDRALDVLHRIINGQTGGHAAPGTVDVEMDVLLRVLALQKEQLSDDGVRDPILHLRPQEDNTILEEPAVDVVAPLSPPRLLDDVRNVVGHGEPLPPLGLVRRGGLRLRIRQLVHVPDLDEGHEEVRNL